MYFIDWSFFFGPFLFLLSSSFNLNTKKHKREERERERKKRSPAAPATRNLYPISCHYSKSILSSTCSTGNPSSSSSYSSFLFNYNNLSYSLSLWKIFFHFIILWFKLSSLFFEALCKRLILSLLDWIELVVLLWLQPALDPMILLLIGDKQNDPSVRFFLLSSD